MNAPSEMHDHTDRMHQAITDRERLLREYRDLMELAAAADSGGLDERTVLRNRLLLVGVPVCTGAVSYLYFYTTILLTVGVMMASVLALVFALDSATPDSRQPGTLQWEASQEIAILIRMMREIVDVPVPREVQALEDANARMHELNDRICARLEILAMSEPCPGKGYISATQ